MQNHDILISWQKIQADTAKLVAQISASGRQFDRIVAVTRGGMVVACLIAQALGIHQVGSIAVRSYSQRDKQEAEILCMPDFCADPVHGNYENWLLVDELSDTGQTAKILRKLWPEAFLACLYVKPCGQDYVDSYVQKFKQENWLIFPWENISSAHSLH